MKKIYTVIIKDAFNRDVWYKDKLFKKYECILYMAPDETWNSDIVFKTTVPVMILSIGGEDDFSSEMAACGFISPTDCEVVSERLQSLNHFIMN